MKVFFGFMTITVIVLFQIVFVVAEVEKPLKKPEKLLDSNPQFKFKSVPLIDPRYQHTIPEIEVTPETYPNHFPFYIPSEKGVPLIDSKNQHTIPGLWGGTLIDPRNNIQNKDPAHYKAKKKHNTSGTQNDTNPNKQWERLDEEQSKSIDRNEVSITKLKNEFDQMEQYLQQYLSTSFTENEEYQSAYLKLAITNLENMEASLNLRNRVFETQYWITNFIFLVTHVILGMAIYVSYKEFKSAEENRNKANQETESKIKISLQGIALKTSRQATIILFAALAFYFMYIKFVYPVVEV